MSLFRLTKQLKEKSVREEEDDDEEPLVRRKKKRRKKKFKAEANALDVHEDKDGDPDDFPYCDTDESEEEDEDEDEEDAPLRKKFKANAVPRIAADDGKIVHDGEETDLDSLLYEGKKFKVGRCFFKS